MNLIWHNHTQSKLLHIKYLVTNIRHIFIADIFYFSGPSNSFFCYKYLKIKNLTFFTMIWPTSCRKVDFALVYYLHHYWKPYLFKRNLKGVFHGIMPTNKGSFAWMISGSRYWFYQVMPLIKTHRNYIFCFFRWRHYNRFSS